MRIGVISSTTNQIIKNTAALLHAKHRREQGKFIVEGARIISNLPEGFTVCYLLIEQGKETGFEHFPYYEVSRAVIEKVSDTVNSQGIIAVVNTPAAKSVTGERVLVLDNVTNPDNVGAIIRSAVAFGFTDVLMVDGTDPFSPKCVRASMGGIFFVNVLRATYQDVAALRAEGYSLLAADMNGEDISTYSLGKRLMLVIGSEAHGVSSELRELADTVLSIPISRVESLNASVAAGIIMYSLTK